MRDTSRDGFINRAESYFLSHFPLFWRFIMAVPALRRWANQIIINRAASRTASRPYALSSMPTKGDATNEIAGYTSWESLTDQEWFGRHLPPRDLPIQPAIEDVVRLFKVGSGGPMLSSRSTLLFPSFAQWFTDGFLMTDMKESRRTMSCHQIDFNPLYGLTREQTQALRLQSEDDGKKGFLKFDLFDGEVYAPKLFDNNKQVKQEFKALRPPLRLDEHLALLDQKRADEVRKSIFAFGGERANSTPYTAMLNTLFLREHNRIAKELQEKNRTWDDERVFQTARTINSVLLIKIVIEEYINHISPYHFCLEADPSVCWHAPWNKPNWIPIEFNLLYRWHSLVPKRFEIGGDTYEPNDILFNNALLTQAGLASLMASASRQRAWELGLFNTAEFLLPIEVASVRQGRKNKIGSYNDYREAFGYPRVKRFEQITDDRAKVDELRKLYNDVENVEFFVGLFAESVPPRAAVPPLIGRMVAFDAFSLALTNPLLSEHVFNEQTFTEDGLHTIEKTKRLQDVLDRNLPAGQQVHVSMDFSPTSGR